METTGSSIEEAKEAALDELGVDEQDAEFQVLEEPKLGLFGRVRTEARVRARVRPTTPRAKDDRRDRRRRSRRPAETAGEAAAAAVAPSPGAAAAPPGLSTAGDQPAPEEPGGAGPSSDDGSEDRPRRRRRRPGRSSAAVGGSATPADGNGASPRTPAPSPRRGRTAANSEDPDGSEGELLMDVALQEQAEVAREFLEGLLRSFHLVADLRASTDDDEERVDVRIDGANLGLLIGPKGATLLAVQDLTRTYVQHRTKARNGRIYVDVAGYREKRAVALAGFVRKVADDVLGSGRPVALEPMSAPDRKIIHDTAAEIPGIATRSEGEDERRHVIISPAETVETD